ncbi:hypothetical protein ES706_03368 [subsurface metagenome]
MAGKAKLVAIYTARQMEAQIIKGRLENEGIPVLLSYDSSSLVFGFTVDGLGEVKIMVPERFAEQAREILRIKYNELEIGEDNQSEAGEPEPD